MIFIDDQIDGRSSEICTRREVLPELTRESTLLPFDNVPTGDLGMSQLYQLSGS